MHDDHPHDLLAQVPLTVSPFLSLPSATTLPYTYKQLPSTLPPSITDPPPTNTTATATNTSTPVGNESQSSASEPAVYIRPPHGGPPTHPAALLGACERLKTHLSQRETDAAKRIENWEELIKARELAEKRRVAPGWLDVDTKMLVPERKGGSGEATAASAGIATQMSEVKADPEADRAGEELDRAFGGLGVS